MAGWGPHPEAVARTTDEARAGRSDRERQLLADPAGAVEATTAVFAEGGERARRFLHSGFRIAYAAYSRRDWEVNTLFMDRHHRFSPGAGQAFIDANREYVGIEDYLDAQQLLLAVWGDVRIELMGVEVIAPALVVALSSWRGTAARSGLVMEWQVVCQCAFHEGLLAEQRFWWDRRDAEAALGVALADVSPPG
jgi:hypothetical protein